MTISPRKKFDHWLNLSYIRNNSLFPKKKKNLEKKNLYVWRVALTKLQIIHLLDKSQSALRKFSKVPVKATFVWKTDAEGYPRPLKKKTLLKF